MSLRVGIDLVRVDDVDASLVRFGARYLDRVYTRAEQAYAEAAPRVRAERLAARFAAKEAVVKVLRPQGARPEWTSIEIVHDAAGAPGVRLRGTAARLAAEAGLATWSVSLSHEDGFAVAAVAATSAGDVPPTVPVPRIPTDAPASAPEGA